MNESRKTLSNLEIIVMEHERTIEQFSELLLNHQAQIDRLQNSIKSLEQKLSKYAEVNDLPEQHEPPPHY